MAVGVSCVGSILPFLLRGVFDDAATKAMGEAFDAACKALHPIGQPQKSSAGRYSSTNCCCCSQRRARREAAS